MSDQNQQPEQEEHIKVPSTQAPGSSSAHEAAAVRSSTNSVKPAHVGKQSQKARSFSFLSTEWPLIVSILLMLVSGVLLYRIEMERIGYASVRQDLAMRIQEKQMADALAGGDVAILDDAFLKDDDIVGFIQGLEQARGAFEAFELNFTSETPEGKSVKYLTFELTVKGPVENIETLLDSLNNSTYVFEITNLEMASEDGFSEQSEMTIIAKIYIAEQ